MKRVKIIAVIAILALIGGLWVACESSSGSGEGEGPTVSGWQGGARPGGSSSGAYTKETAQAFVSAFFAGWAKDKGLDIYSTAADILAALQDDYDAKEMDLRGIDELAKSLAVLLSGYDPASTDPDVVAAIKLADAIIKLVDDNIGDESIAGWVPDGGKVLGSHPEDLAADILGKPEGLPNVATQVYFVGSLLGKTPPSVSDFLGLTGTNWVAYDWAGDGADDVPTVKAGSLSYDSLLPVTVRLEIGEKKTSGYNVILYPTVQFVVNWGAEDYAGAMVQIDYLGEGGVAPTEPDYLYYGGTAGYKPKPGGTVGGISRTIVAVSAIANNAAAARGTPNTDSPSTVQIRVGTVGTGGTTINIATFQCDNGTDTPWLGWDGTTGTINKNSGTAGTANTGMGHYEVVVESRVYNITFEKAP